MELILASGSPRRKELLTQMRIPFTVVPSDVDEHISGRVEERVKALAERKASALCSEYPGRYILAADTLVAVAGEVLGKPRDAEDAFRMISLLQGRAHFVFSGVCLICPDGTKDIRIEKTEVLFSRMTDSEIHAYVSTGEPFGKAGAYAIQGIAGMYVQSVSGSFSNVIGLPTCTVRNMLKQHGFELNV